MHKKQAKMINIGQYVAEVDVELIHTDDEWSPYLSLEDAQKLDAVREALKKGEIKKASSLAQVYTLCLFTEQAYSSTHFRIKPSTGEARSIPL